MYRRLLVPVNEPSEVEPLIRFAANFLDADGEIRTLHVIPSTNLPEMTRQWRSSVNLVIPAHEAGAALDIRVDPEVRASPDVPGEILEAAEAHNVDGIFMTLRGGRGSRNPFVGHTASPILHHAPCDVLVVNRLALIEEKVPRVLIPTFAGSPAPKALQLAEEISVRNHGIPIVTLSLSVKGEENGEGPTPPRTTRGVPLEVHRSFFPRALLGRPRRLPDLVLQLAARERYGLLLVGEGPQGMTGPLLTRRFLEMLFRNAPCPVLAVRG